MLLAFNDLVFIGDKSSLLDVLLKVQDIDCLKYTPASIEKIYQTYNEGVRIYNDDNAL